MLRAAAIIPLALAGAAMADVLNVPSQYPTIKAAITAAVNGDTVLIADGVYTGAGNINFSFAGKAITVRSANGPAACILDAAHTSVIVTFITGEGPGSILQGLTLRQGNAGEGGAIRCNAASPTIRGCIFDNGWAGYHSAGVGCISSSNPLIEDCTFVDGLAGVGGAVYSITGSHPKLIRCTIRNHRTDLFGAAAVGCGAGSALTIDRCTFIDNQAIGFSPYGGAIMVSGSATITNSLFVNNNAGAGGGAIACGAGTSIINCTFTGNIAGSGAGGGGGAIWSQSGSPVVTNCILWGNSPDEVFGASQVSYSTVAGAWPGPGNIAHDPLFTNPGAGDYRLGAGSPCIDAGNSTAIPPALTLDLGNQDRREDDPKTPDTGIGPPPVIDMGAHEVQGGGCYADCNLSFTLTIADFACFQAKFVQGNFYADCNNSGTLTIADFACFQAAFFSGCP